MKKKITVSEKKDSIPDASQTVTDVKITENTICVVSFVVPGSFARHGMNANTKEEIRKMKASPILDENKKGRFICSSYGAPGRRLAPNEKLPSAFYVGPKHYNLPTYHTCSERRVYNSESLMYLSSDEARPYGYTKKQWDVMNTKERLTAQFAIDAWSVNINEPSFIFEFVN